MDPFTTGAVVGATVTSLAAVASKLDTEKKIKENKDELEKMQKELESTKTEVRFLEAGTIMAVALDAAAAFGSAATMKKNKEDLDKRCDRIEAKLSALTGRSFNY